MARKPLIVTRDFPYHITNRSNNREWFYLPIDEAWEIFCNVLARCVDLYETEIRSFVLMANHYHLILSTPLGNLGEVIRYLQVETARSIQRRTGRINHIFGGRYKWSALMNPSAVAYAYKYVARNPVAASLCERVEDYPYSTLFSLHRGIPPSLPIMDDIGFLRTFIPKDWEDRLDWLNRPSPKELDVLISKALRRFEFSFSKGNEYRLKLEQLSQCYAIPLPSLVEAPATFSAEK